MVTPASCWQSQGGHSQEPLHIPAGWDMTREEPFQDAGSAARGKRLQPSLLAPGLPAEGKPWQRVTLFSEHLSSAGSNCGAFVRAAPGPLRPDLLHLGHRWLPWHRDGAGSGTGTQGESWSPTRCLASTSCALFLLCLTLRLLPSHSVSDTEITVHIPTSFPSPACPHPCPIPSHPSDKQPPSAFSLLLLLRSPRDSLHSTTA